MEHRSIISSATNQTIKKARALRQRKTREDLGLFLIEGIHPVGSAIEAGWAIETILYAPTLLTSGYGRTLVQQQNDQGTPCLEVEAGLFNSIADKENPQGILAIAHQRHLNFGDLAAGQSGYGIAVVSPQDPGNVGTILRTLDAVGADGFFLLDGGVDPYHPTVIRASMGALFWKPIVQATFEEFISWSRKAGYRIVGTSAHAKQDYHIIHGQRNKTLLLLGNEQKGLSPEYMAACDLVVSLPMHGRVSSLNLAVAAGLLLYELMGE